MHRRSAYARRCFFSKEMPMYWTEQITLLRDTPKKVQGVLEHHYTQVRTVYGERRSVKWAEFFAAEAAGTTLTAVFVLHADEYSGERVIEWNGNRYSVQRAYETGSTVELTVSDLAQPKGEAL
nr:MAG TPA: head closure knob [Caudoviricetes sp.]DAR26534.1 MAG TPA: head closure knob [Caudoviricetes sp.]